MKQPIHFASPGTQACRHVKWRLIDGNITKIGVHITLKASEM
jgi:hypothetical protein